MRYYITSKGVSGLVNATDPDDPEAQVLVAFFDNGTGGITDDNIMKADIFVPPAGFIEALHRLVKKGYLTSDRSRIAPEVVMGPEVAPIEVHFTPIGRAVHLGMDVGKEPGMKEQLGDPELYRELPRPEPGSDLLHDQ